ncbi:MAG: hypothetical protein NWE78_07525, partial [Candidatus Bathyarchaeota archaeon]|nr:hypothetical protein [Candidatus Bathyarchaeota archaeon]
LVKKGAITMRIIRSRMHFMVQTQTQKCPKCGTEIHAPNKSWLMTGRADKDGNRTQLHIGLFKCPNHGFFRKAMGKLKIRGKPRSPAKIKLSDVKKRATTKKEKARKKTSRKKGTAKTKERRPKDWPLI